MAILIGAVGAHVGAGQNLSAAIPATASLLWAVTVFAVANRFVLRDLLPTRVSTRNRQPTAFGH